MMIESQIRLLNRTDEDIQADEKRIQDKKVNGRILQIDNMILMMNRFTGKNGKVLPKYAREILKLENEKKVLAP
jgi:hypothetical protein